VSKNRPNRLQNPQQSHELRAVRAEFSGPLPPPNVLERYAAIIPNGAERIMAMAEKQATHRHGLEKAVVDGNLRAQARGQVYALIVVLAGMVSGTVLVALGRPVEGLASIFVPLAAAAAIFFTGRRGQERERKKKLEDQNEQVRSG